MWQKKDDSPSVSIVYGFLRTIRRRLYLVNNDQQCTIATPVSVMDFFVHPSVQKQGYALVLFNNMLEAEKVEPYQCAFDKPNASLLQFLHKHFGLQEPVWQSTNFAVFLQFFESPIEADHGKSNKEADSARTASTPV
jgi:alpha-tubulin N-acetyltransferase 1